jgi:hypothetical protein
MNKFMNWLDKHFFTASTALVIFITTSLYFIIGISK